VLARAILDQSTALAGQPLADLLAGRVKLLAMRHAA